MDLKKAIMKRNEYSSTKAKKSRNLAESDRINLLIHVPIEPSVRLVRPTCEPLDRESLIGGPVLYCDWPQGQHDEVIRNFNLSNNSHIVASQSNAFCRADSSDGVIAAKMKSTARA